MGSSGGKYIPSLNNKLKRNLINVNHSNSTFNLDILYIKKLLLTFFFFNLQRNKLVKKDRLDMNVMTKVIIIV